MEPLDRRQRVALGAIVATAFGLRLAYVVGQRGDVLFDYPVIDEERYVEMARGLANGKVEPKPWLQPPGLVYALALVFRVAGSQLLAPRIVQAALSAAACFVAFAVARRLFATPVALATAAICALHGVLIFESYELLPPTWVMTADLLALWALLVAGETKTPASALVAGIALGVSAVFAPVVLPFGAVAALWLRKGALVAAFVAGVAAPIAPVTLGNWQRGHELVLVSTNGGVNFFIGNNPDYDATLAMRPGERWLALMDEPRRAGVVGSGSAYFYAKGASFWRDHPGRALSLYAKKVWLYFGGAELPRDTDIYAARGASRLLAALVTRGPPWFPDGLLVPLALVGAAACWRDRRRLVVAYGFLATQALIVAAFFVSSRYRAPALPVLAMFAAAAVVELRRAWAARAGLPRAAPFAAALALAVALNVPSRESSASYAAELDFYRGLAYARHLHAPARAVDAFRAATVRDPSDARFWFELGNALETARRYDEAIDAWRRAAPLDRADARPLARVAAVLADRGDLAGAIDALDASLAGRAADAPSSASDRMTRAALLVRRGDCALALDELRAVERAEPRAFRARLERWTRGALATPSVGDADLWLTVGDMLRDRGSAELADSAWRRAAAAAPGPSQRETLRTRLAPNLADRVVCAEWWIRPGSRARLGKRRVRVGADGSR